VVWTFYATIVWGIDLHDRLPGLAADQGATPGLLGYSTRADVAAEIARFEPRTPRSRRAAGRPT
jgi:cytochrome c oxidase cbb3-type subunit III